jgi:hypothetical protein
MLNHAETPSCSTTSCQLSATTYSIYSQLLCTSGGLLNQQLDVMVTMDPHNVEDNIKWILKYILNKQDVRV